MINKRAQVGSTLTWLVATVVIVVILIFSIFVAVPVVAKMKVFGVASESIHSKSFSSYLLTKDQGDFYYNQLIGEDNFNEENSKFLKDVFLLSGLKRWAGVVDRTDWREKYDDPLGRTVYKNKFFGDGVSCLDGKFQMYYPINENKRIIFCLE